MSRSSPPDIARVVSPELPASWPADGFGPIAELIERLPEPSSLEPGAWLAVSEGSGARRGISRLFRKPPAAHLAVRCAALLARGYESVGAGRTKDGELAWGRAPGP